MSRTFRFPDAVPTLCCDALFLRELVEDDIPGWFARASDAESASLAGDSIPQSITMGEAWLQGHRARFCARAAIRWAIVPTAESASVGTVGLILHPGAAGIAELGLVIGRAHWNRGLGTAAARLAVRYGFGTMGLAEIHAEILRRNLASRRLFGKLGFTLRHAVAGEEGCDIYGLSRPQP